ncbi:hypothetical protein Bca4012_071099 [Brassica carinata]|uniref:Uncharacterized protein n=2 Tax=Brassica TaxID=3705 RepID=A0A0D3CDW0_BRAOL|nr:unnamed protein product [Brassica napus]
MSLSMRNELTLFGRTTGLFTADMKLHLHKTFLNQMFGTWTDSLKSLQTCAQEFDYTEDLHTLSRTRPRSLKVWLWEGSYSVTTETCRVMLSWKNKICSLYVQYKVSTVTYSDSLLITANYETSATRCQV